MQTHITYQKIFIFRSGEFLSQWKDKDLLRDVMPNAAVAGFGMHPELAPGCAELL